MSDHREHFNRCDVCGADTIFLKCTGCALKSQQATDALSPSYYKAGGIESWDVIEAFGLSYHCADALAYILRAGKKGDKKQDLQKAIRHLQREVEELQRAEARKVGQ